MSLTTWQPGASVTVKLAVDHSTWPMAIYDQTRKYPLLLYFFFSVCQTVKRQQRDDGRCGPTIMRKEEGGGDGSKKNKWGQGTMRMLRKHDKLFPWEKLRSQIGWKRRVTQAFSQACVLLHLKIREQRRPDIIEVHLDIRDGYAYHFRFTHFIIPRLDSRDNNRL